MSAPDPYLRWLSQRERERLNLPHYRATAVLVALTREDDPRLLLTLRSPQMPTHGGQVSFPGGGLKAGESPLQAALREAWEEVGLPPNAVTVLGELDDVSTPAGFHVTPLLAYRHDVPLTPSAEVSALLQPRLSELRACEEAAPNLRYPWGGHLIWGMTAKIVRGLLSAPEQSGAKP